jgi:hypothetical protein
MPRCWPACSHNVGFIWSVSPKSLQMLVLLRQWWLMFGFLLSASLAGRHIPDAHGGKGGGWAAAAYGGGFAAARILCRRRWDARTPLYISRRQATATTPWHRHYFVRKGRRRPHTTRAVAIYAAADYRSSASASVLTRLRRRIEPGLLPGGPNKTSARRERTLCAFAEMYPRHIFGPGPPRTVWSLCVAQLEQEHDAFFDPADTKSYSASVCVALA